MSNVSWMERAGKVLFQNYKQAPIAIVRGLGAKVWDADGTEYIDWLGGVATVALGHNHPAVRAAVEAQLGKLWHISNHYYNAPQIELAERLVSTGHAQRAFFCNSGTEANEAALKLVRKFHASNGHPEKFEFLCAIDSFHGRTMGALSATGQPKYHQGFEPLVPGFKHLPFGDLAAFEKAVGPNTGAIMIECVQGESGVIVPQAGFIAGLRKLCDAHGLLLVLDEVQGGFGRTGKFWSFEHEGVTPDLFSVAKALGNGLPIGALLATERVAAAMTPGSHGTTYGGNPVAAAGACAVFDELVHKGAMARGRVGSERLIAGFRALQSQTGDLIREIRHRGMWIGLTFRDGRAPKVLAEARSRGLLVNAVSDTSMRFAPSLLISDSEIDAGLERFADAVGAAG